MPPVESSQTIPESVGAAIERALETLGSLGVLGEEVEDEWQYVQDLADAWRERLAIAGDGRAAESLPLARGTAVVRACDEAAMIDDPHRAIDWLSTFPQVVLAAIGERP